MSTSVGHASRHPDRVDLPTWSLLAVLGATGVVAGIGGHLVTRAWLAPVPGFLGGVGLSLLGTLGIPSVSIRLTARVFLALSAVVLLRFGIGVGSVGAGGQELVAWLVAAVVLFVVTDRIGTEANPRLAGSAPPRNPAASTARTAAAVAAVVALAAIVLAPVLAPRVGRPDQAGQPADEQATSSDASLRASSSLDMTTRPALTDKVMFTVDTNRATFLRGETFDVWDGRTWTRSDTELERLGPGNVVRHAPDDLGSRGDDVVHAQIHVQAAYANILYAAASPTSVVIDHPVIQHPDGTLLGGPLGRGATYTVTSRRFSLSDAALRGATGPIPDAVAERYAAKPVTTARVAAAARRVTAGRSTEYDRVLALESWMGRRTRYSLDAPLAPEGVDVVDHFLFTSRQGWCEQVASSLVVLARSVGIPARLATGFVPGEQDPVTGTFTVRAKDAHAWAEVWFPKLGWVPFDPTASVPLAGQDHADQTVGDWFAHHWVELALGLAGVALVAGPLRGLVRRRLARRAARPTAWAPLADAALAELGAPVERPRAVGETASAHGLALAQRYRDPRLAEVGRALDDAVFARTHPDPARQAWVDEVLRDVAAKGPPEPADDPAPAGDPVGVP